MRAPAAALATLRRVNELLLAGSPPSSIAVIGSQWRHARVLEHLLDVSLPMGAFEVTCISEVGFAAACVDSLIEADIVSPKIPSTLCGTSGARAFMHASMHMLPLDAFRPLNDPTRYVDELSRYFRWLRRLGIEPDALEAHARSNWTSTSDAGRERELAAAYAAWVTIKDNDPGSWDTADVIALSLRATRGTLRSQLAKWVSRQWRHIIVADGHDSTVACATLIAAACGNQHGSDSAAPDPNSTSPSVSRVLHKNWPTVTDSCSKVLRSVDIFACPSTEYRYGPASRMTALWQQIANASACTTDVMGDNNGRQRQKCPLECSDDAPLQHGTAWTWQVHSLVDNHVAPSGLSTAGKKYASTSLEASPVLSAEDLPPSARVCGVPPGADADSAACDAVINALQEEIRLGRTSARDERMQSLAVDFTKENSLGRRPIVGLLARSEDHAVQLATALRDALRAVSQGVASDTDAQLSAQLARVSVLCNSRTRIGDVAEVRLLLAAIAAVAFPDDPIHAYTLASSPVYSVPHDVLSRVLFSPSATVGKAAFDKPLDSTNANALHRVLADVAHCAAVFDRTASATAVAAAFLKRSGLAAEMQQSSATSARHAAVADALAAALRLLAEVENAAGFARRAGESNAVLTSAGHASRGSRSAQRGMSALYSATLAPRPDGHLSFSHVATSNLGGNGTQSSFNSGPPHSLQQIRQHALAGREQLAFVHAQVMHAVLSDGATVGGGAEVFSHDPASHYQDAAGVSGDSPAGGASLQLAAEAAEAVGDAAILTIPIAVWGSNAAIIASRASEAAAGSGSSVQNVFAGSEVVWSSVWDAIEADDVAAVQAAFTTGTNDGKSNIPAKRSGVQAPVVVVLPYRRAGDAAFDDVVIAWASDSSMPGQNRPPLLRPPTTLLTASQCLPHLTASHSHAARKDSSTSQQVGSCRTPSYGDAKNTSSSNGVVGDVGDLYVPYPRDRNEYVEWERHRLRLLLHRVRRSVTFIAPERSLSHPVSSQRRSRFLDELFGRDATSRSGTSIVKPCVSSPTASDQGPSMLTTPHGSHNYAVRMPILLTSEPTSPLEPFFLSHSKVSEYEWCPHRYYLSRVVRVPRPNVPMALLYGRAMHEAVAVMGRAVRDTLAKVSIEAGLRGHDNGGFADATNQLFMQPDGAVIGVTAASVTTLMAAITAGSVDACGNTADVTSPAGMLQVNSSELARRAHHALPSATTLLRDMKEAYHQSWTHAGVDGAGGHVSQNTPVSAARTAADENRHALNLPYSTFSKLQGMNGQVQALHDFAANALETVIQRELDTLKRRLQDVSGAGTHDDPQTALARALLGSSSSQDLLTFPTLVEESFAVDILPDAATSTESSCSDGDPSSEGVRLVGIIDRVDVAPAATLAALICAPSTKRRRGKTIDASLQPYAQVTGAESYVREYKTSRQWKSQNATAASVTTKAKERSSGEISNRDMPQLATYAIALQARRSNVLSREYGSMPVDDALHVNARASRHIQREESSSGGVTNALYGAQYVALENMEDGGRSIVSITSDAQRVTAASFLRVAAQIRSGAYPPTPSPVQCGLCPYQIVCTHAHGTQRAVVGTTRSLQSIRVL